MEFIIKVIGIPIAMLCLVIAAAYWINSSSCHAKWEGSGMATRWWIMSDCQVQRKDGTWVPASVYREVQQQ